MLLLFTFGFALSLLGSLPPGLISLTVAHTAIRRGLAAALLLALGAAFAEFFQAWLAVVLTDWFLSHPTVESAFRWLAVIVFFTLGVHLLFFTQPLNATTAMPNVALRHQFLKGVVISAFNLLAIPYWFVYCGWLRMEGWWLDGLFSTLFFSAGVMVGTFFSLSLYSWLGLIILKRAEVLAHQANKLVGLIFLGLGVNILLGLLR